MKLNFFGFLVVSLYYCCSSSKYVIYEINIHKNKCSDQTFSTDWVLSYLILAGINNVRFESYNMNIILGYCCDLFHWNIYHLAQLLIKI